MKISRLLLTISALLAALPMTLASAQSNPSHEVVGASQQPQAAAQQQGGNADEQWFSQAQLDQMLAPIALYPDTVLTHVLIAATYPLEVVEADRWRQQNPDLDAESALNAVEDQPWDASVKALVAFPHLLSRMSQDLRWTQDLGDAFLISEGDVMDRVQSLRNAAYDQGELATTEQVKIIVEKEIIIIEPAVERVVYLPYYDTRVVYGSWRWSSYPPIYWDPFYPSVYHRHSVYWGPAVRVTPSFYIGAFFWPQRHVVVVNHYDYSPHPVFYSSRSLVHHSSAKRWQHASTHRRGVAYHPVYETRYPERVERRSYENRIFNRPITERDFRRDTSPRDVGRVSSSPARQLQNRDLGDAELSASTRDRDRSAVSSVQRQRGATSEEQRLQSGQGGLEQGIEQQQRQRSAAQRTDPQGVAAQRTSVPDTEAQGNVSQQRTREQAVVREQPQRTREQAIVRQQPQRTREQAIVRQQPQRAREQAVVREQPQRAREQAVVREQPQRAREQAFVREQVVVREQPQRAREQALRTQQPQRATEQALRTQQPQRATEQAIVRQQPQRAREQAIGTQQSRDVRQQPERARESAVAMQPPQAREQAMVRQPQRDREPQRNQGRNSDIQHNEE